jgi:hypothetical protein
MDYDIKQLVLTLAETLEVKKKVHGVQTPTDDELLKALNNYMKSEGFDYE